VREPLLHRARRGAGGAGDQLIGEAGLVADADGLVGVVGAHAPADIASDAFPSRFRQEEAPTGIEPVCTALQAAA
jgi:hypothetical protein